MRRPLVIAGIATSLLLGGCGGNARPAGTDGTTGAPSAAAAGSSRVPPASPSSGAEPSHSAQPAPPTVTARAARWSLRRPLAREVVVQEGKSAVVAGGLVAGDSSTSNAFRVDLGTGRQTPLPALTVAVHDAAGADLGGRVLVVGGGNVTEQATVQQLDGRLRWRVIGQLPSARSDLVTATVGEHLIVAGGYDGTVSPADILMSSDGHIFRVVGELAAAVRYPAVAVAAGAVWLFGGEVDGHLVDVVQRVDVRTGQCRVVARLPHPLGHSAAVSVAGRVLLAGGRTGPDAVTSAMWWFDPSTSRFRRAGRLPYPLADTGVAQSRGSTYLLGGETPSLTSSVVRIMAH